MGYFLIVRIFFLSLSLALLYLLYLNGLIVYVIFMLSIFRLINMFIVLDKFFTKFHFSFKIKTYLEISMICIYSVRLFIASPLFFGACFCKGLFGFFHDSLKFFGYDNPSVSVLSNSPSTPEINKVEGVNNTKLLRVWGWVRNTVFFGTWGYSFYCFVKVTFFPLPGKNLVDFIIAKMIENDSSSSSSSSKNKVLVSDIDPDFHGNKRKSLFYDIKKNLYFNPSSEDINKAYSTELIDLCKKSSLENVRSINEEKPELANTDVGVVKNDVVGINENLVVNIEVVENKMAVIKVSFVKNDGSVVKVSYGYTRISN